MWTTASPVHECSTKLWRPFGGFAAAGIRHLLPRHPTLALFLGSQSRHLDCFRHLSPPPRSVTHRQHIFRIESAWIHSCQLSLTMAVVLGCIHRRSRRHPWQVPTRVLHRRCSVRTQVCTSRYTTSHPAGHPGSCAGSPWLWTNTAVSWGGWTRSLSIVHSGFCVGRWMTLFWLCAASMASV